MLWAQESMAPLLTGCLLDCWARCALCLQEHTRAVFASLDVRGAGWLEPAQWLTMLRILAPELGPVEAR